MRFIWRLDSCPAYPKGCFMTDVFYNGKPVTFALVKDGPQYYLEEYGTEVVTGLSWHAGEGLANAKDFAQDYFDDVGVIAKES